jgi:nitroreductase
MNNMNNINNLVSAIRVRRSVRSYQDKPLSPADREFVLLQVDDLARRFGPHGTRVRPVVSADNDTGKRSGESRKIGTYGVIQGARFYVGAVVSGTPEAMVDLGYLFEELVLHLTLRGLGTCWLGGTFNRKTFSGLADLSPTEVLPVITPVGYPRTRPGISDRLVRRMAGSDHRIPFEKLFFQGSFDQPLTPQAATPWTEALEMVRTGPSASNKQPWRVVVSNDNRAHVFLARTPGYVGAKLGFDIQRIDIGIAMFHLETAMKSAGFTCRWEFTPPEIDLPDEHTEFVVSLVPE